MTVSAPAVRPRILAELTGRPGQTSYEVAAALGYGKPDSRYVAAIVTRMWRRGDLAAGTIFRPGQGRPVRIFAVALPGTPPRPRKEPPDEAERRRARERVRKTRSRARTAGSQAPSPGGDRRRTVLRPAAASLGPDSRRAVCRNADPDLFFGTSDERPKARAARVAKARVCCFACPIRLACLRVAEANREVYGVWGGVDFETERGQRSAQAARADVAASGRA